MLLSTASAVLEAERKRSRAQVWWTVAPIPLYAAWSALMFLLLTALRPSTTFSAEYIAVMTLWYVGWRLIAVKVRPSSPGARAVARGDVF